ncbi:MAG: beta-ketoacyl-ACP synthase II [bacterium]|nr:beta-ketoacyl-ACP synthase II [bacterium]
MHQGLKSPRRCVITGLGVVSPIGIGQENFWKALCAGKSGVSRITSFDTSELNTKIAAEIKDFNPLNYIGGKTANRIGRASQFGITAAKLALEDANLDLHKEDMEKIAVIIGGGVGGLSFAEDQVTKCIKEGFAKISPFLAINIFGGALSSEIALELGLKGPSITISTGCPAGTDAIGQAFKAIRDGRHELIIAGGAEAAIRPITLLSFLVMGALSARFDEPTKVSRPFDAKRDGFVLGEGGGIVILEELEHAKARGAHIYGEVIGYAMTTDAYHMVAPAPGGKELVRAFKLALEDADVSPEDIDYINSHGSSTPLGDRIETFVIKQVFGQQAYHIPISATKSMLGHSIGATGAVELIVCALTLETGIIPPTINYEYPDPECDLDYVPNKAREKIVNIALSNSIGFGGKNSCIVIRKMAE